MATKSKQTASFMIRFNQNIYEEDGESQVQWRGKISHVQDGDAVSFADMNKAMDFIKEKLTIVTKNATDHKPDQEQEGLIDKSLDILKKVRSTGPKFLIDTLKDPKKQVTQIQDQIQDQISQVSHEISNKVEIDQWRAASKNDIKQVREEISTLTDLVLQLSKKMDALSK